MGLGSGPKIPVPCAINMALFLILLMAVNSQSPAKKAVEHAGNEHWVPEIYLARRRELADKGPFLSRNLLSAERKKKTGRITFRRL